MKKIYFSFLLSLLFSICFCQTPGVKWTRPLGGTSSERAYDVQKTIDGGYLSVSNTISNNIDVSGHHGGGDIWVVKMNSFGAIEWQKCLGGAGTEQFKRLVYNPDGTALIVGVTNSSNGDILNFHGTQDIWAVKIDIAGNIIWQNSLGGTALEEFRNLDITLDNGYIITGYTTSNDGDVNGNHGGEDIWVVKLTNTGNIEWQKCLGGTGSERPRSILSMPDGNFIMVGSTASNNGDVTNQHGNNDLWIIKLNALGNITWQKAYGGTNSETGFRAVVSNSGSITVLANAFSNDGDVVGHNGSSVDVWIVDVSYNDGTLNWQKCIGGSSEETPVSLLKDAQGMYLVAATTISSNGDAVSNHGQRDVLLTRLTNSGLVNWSKCFGGERIEDLFDVYNDTVTSQSKYNAALKVFDVAGKLLWRQIQVINKGFNTIALPSVAQFSTGIYTLQLKAEHKVITKQFAVVK